MKTPTRHRKGRGHRSLAVVGTVIAVVLLVSGYRVAAAGREQTAPRPVVLNWAACTGPDAQPGSECATLAVPLDWTNPGSGTISVALARLSAANPDRRIGALLLNPGGPGGSGVAAVAYDPTWSSTPEFESVRERFDIVGFDPRGVGRSTPITCPMPLHDPQIDTFPQSQAEFAELSGFNLLGGRACRAATGPLIDHVDTPSVVQDVEAMRSALGESQISFVGLSYGTEIGVLYAQRYPTRVRGMVLDGVVNHALPAQQAALDEARATEQALGRFVSWCEGSMDCPLPRQHVLDVFDDLLAAADTEGVPASALGSNVGAAEITAGVYGYLQLRAAWPQLAAAIAGSAGLTGPPDASQLIGAANFASTAYPAYRTIGCHDFAPRIDGWIDLQNRAAELRAAAPRTWQYSEFWDWTSGCAGWPVRAANPPQSLRVTGIVPILLVANRYDPATPYPWAQDVQQAIAGSTLLTVDADGHTGILHSSCARTRMAQYLVDGTVPAPGTVCAPTESA